jgi:hypothetical protein
VTPAAANHYAVVTDAANPDVAGSIFDVTVMAQDPFGNTDTNYTGTVHFSSLDPYGAMLPADYAFQPSDQGSATFNAATALYTAGPWDVTATDTGRGIAGTAVVNVQAAAAVALQVVAPPSVPSGMPFDVTVIAVDPYGNTDTNYLSIIHFTTTDPDPRVKLPPDYAFQPSDAGIVTFAGGVILITPGSQTVTATDTASGITGGATVIVTPSSSASSRRGRRDARVLTTGAPDKPGSTAVSSGFVLTCPVVAFGFDEGPSCLRNLDLFFTFMAETGDRSRWMRLTDYVRP